MLLKPVLPRDIEREIFELAALRCHRARNFGPITRYMLVAERVHQWLEPILYSVIVQAPGGKHSERPSEYRYPPRTVYSVHPADDCRPEELVPYHPRFAKHARHLLLQTPARDPAFHVVALDILKSCCNLQNLSIWLNSVSESHSFKALQPFIEKLALRKLSVDVHELIGDGAADSYFTSQPTLFSNLTHLHVQRLSSFESDGPKRVKELARALSGLPRLTDFASATRRAKTIRILLDNLTTVTTIVINLDSRHSFTESEVESLCDKRLVFIHLQGYYVPLFGDWEAGALRGEDRWTTARRIQENGTPLEKQLSDINSQISDLFNGT